MSASFDRLAAALADRYRLDRELGQGGMATVYLARDLKHDREVALKVLRPELAAVIGAERFLAEIKTTAHLQHPHILPLFDSGAARLSHPERSEGSPEFLYYVMPLIEGESLRDRLGREKQLPVGDAVRIAGEVASALDYAHRHGVIHRDIKPENILLHVGQALVADFGIALAASRAGGARMTETGMSLGTPHYMSPEQAMGEREITARSDVYALGCVLYEMLVGEPPFTGPTAQAILAKVLSSQPVRPTEARKSIPPAVEDAILTALEKLPADRWGSASEFAGALAGTSSHPSATPRRPGQPPRSAGVAPSRRGALGWSGAALAAVTLAFVAGRATHRAPFQPPSRLAIIATSLGGSGSSALSGQIALTPDGDAIVFVGSTASTTALFFQRLDAPEPAMIPGTAGLWSPQVSGDGHWLIGSNLNSAYRLPLEGGAPRALPSPTMGTWGAWSPDGSFWFTEAARTGIDRLDPRDSVDAPFRERTLGLSVQQILDDGRTALVVRAPPGTVSGPGLLLDLKTAVVTPLVEGPVIALRYVAGELLTVLPDGSLTATPFDAGGHRLTGPPAQIATGVSLAGTGTAQIAVAPNGTVAYVPESPRSLVFLDRSGAMRPAITERLNLHAPHFSPDGRRLSLDITSTDGRDVWILSLDQGTLSRATFDRNGHDATWSPDGRLIIYTSFRNGVFGVYRTRPGSSTPAESLIASTHLSYTGAWLRDGSALITTAIGLRPNSGLDIGIVRNGGRGPIEPLVASPFQEQYAAPSPDGRWLAFASDQSGRQEVYVQPLGGEGDQVQVSQEGGTEPVWGPDGRELVYRSANGGHAELVAATIRTTPAFAVIGRRPLFPVQEMVGTVDHANYDISPDGRTFAMVRSSPATRIMIIQNLPELLRRIRGAAGMHGAGN
jgi:serine/threonine-protein kinase